MCSPHADCGHAAVGLVVVDVDRFSELNARHGPGVGDSVISELGDILVTGTRREDAVARLGPGSYAVLVAPSDGRRVRGLADRLRRDVAAYPWWRLSPGLAVTINADVILRRRVCARLITGGQARHSRAVSVGMVAAEEGEGMGGDVEDGVEALDGAVG